MTREDTREVKLDTDQRAEDGRKTKTTEGEGVRMYESKVDHAPSGVEREDDGEN